MYSLASHCNKKPFLNVHTVHYNDTVLAISRPNVNPLVNKLADKYMCRVFAHKIENLATQIKMMIIINFELLIEKCVCPVYK